MKDRNAKARIHPFIILYFIVILLFFVVSLFHASRQSFNKYYLGSQADERYEFKDDASIALVFQISQNNIIGFSLNDYSSNGLVFDDEYLEITINDYETMERYQAATIMLSDQISEKHIFVPFTRQYTPGTKIIIQIKSHGLFNKGILLGMSKTQSYGNITWINGRLQKQKYLCSSLFEKTVQKDYLKPVLYLSAELLIGIILVILSRRRSYPDFKTRGQESISEIAASKHTFSVKELMQTLLGM